MALDRLARAERFDRSGQVRHWHQDLPIPTIVDLSVAIPAIVDAKQIVSSAIIGATDWSDRDCRVMESDLQKLYDHSSEFRPVSRVQNLCHDGPRWGPTQLGMDLSGQ